MQNSFNISEKPDFTANAAMPGFLLFIISELLLSGLNSPHHVEDIFLVIRLIENVENAAQARISVLRENKFHIVVLPAGIDKSGIIVTELRPVIRPHFLCGKAYKRNSLIREDIIYDGFFDINGPCLVGHLFQVLFIIKN